MLLSSSRNSFSLLLLPLSIIRATFRVCSQRCSDAGVRFAFCCWLPWQCSLKTWCKRRKGLCAEKVNARANFRVFRGIPFAQSTAGANRWMPPKEMAPWTSVLDATKFRAACPQNGKPKLVDTSEDCLFLNVWTPISGSQRPVMVYIHGGGVRLQFAAALHSHSHAFFLFLCCLAALSPLFVRFTTCAAVFVQYVSGTADATTLGDSCQFDADCDGVAQLSARMSGISEHQATRTDHSARKLRVRARAFADSRVDCIDYSAEAH